MQPPIVGGPLPTQGDALDELSTKPIAPGGKLCANFMSVGQKKAQARARVFR
jgi:hypothetical protein